MLCSITKLNAQRIIEIETTSPTDSIFIEKEFCGVGKCRVNVLGGDGIRRIIIRNRSGLQKIYPQLIESGDSIMRRKIYSQLEYKWSCDVTAEQKIIIVNIVERMVSVSGGHMYRRGNGEYHKIEDFYLDAYNISQKEWQTIMGYNPSEFKGEDRPVENISYNQAVSFVEKINKLSGLKFDLPNDSQFDYIVYNGHISGNGGAIFASPNYCKYKEGTQPVTYYGPSKLGLYAICNNVMIWTLPINLYVKQGQYGKERYPFINEEADYGVLRGCKFYDDIVRFYEVEKNKYKVGGISGLRLAHSMEIKDCSIISELQNKEIAPRKPNYKNLFKEENPRQDLLDLAVKYIEGKDGFVESPHKAKELYLEAVKDGCIEANYYLGMLYKSPLLGEPDKEMAMEYFLKSASNAHAPSLYEVGYYMYEIKEYKQAVDCFKLAGDMGHSDAITMLATMYYHGEGVAVNKNVAMALFFRATELGNKFAEFNLASGYSSSHKGVTYDPKCMEKHLKSSAEKGYNEAIKSYGEYLYDKKRYDECIEWLERGDEMNIADSQYLLALCYKKGKGVDVDMESYLYYLQRAAANNHKKAKDEINEF